MLRSRGVSTLDVTPEARAAITGTFSLAGLMVRRRWWVAFCVVFALVLLQALPGLVSDEERQDVVPRMIYLSIELPAVIGALSFGYARAERRWLSAKSTFILSLLIAGLLGSLLAVIAHVAFPWIGLRPSERFKALSSPVVALAGGIFGLFHCGIWALAFVYPATVERARLRALEAERLLAEAERLRTEAELARLRSQLEPHFLLNTLNAIAGLVTQDPRTARRLLGCLGDLLRDSVSDSSPTQRLDDELEWLERYAEILESRHGEGLRFVWEVDEAVRGIVVPRLLLQPLVENAVTHGALRRPGGGVVTIRARRAERSTEAQPVLECVIEDNGPGLSKGPDREGAVGLHTVRRRLALSDPAGALRLESSSQGTRAIVEMPLSGAR